MRKFIDRVGQRHGLLTVIARASERMPDGRIAWLCDCECGAQRIVSSSAIKNMKSCGCSQHRQSPRGVLTQAHLQELLHYEPQTGVFYWRVAPVNHPELVGRRAGYQRPDGYWCIKIDGTSHLGHRLAWLHQFGYIPKEIDHKNHNRSSCRIADLRNATRAENKANAKTRSDSHSGIKGVRQQRHRWIARIQDTHIGSFATADGARAAYIAVAKILYGEFAHDGKAV